jgi:hypothetical protein
MLFIYSGGVAPFCGSVFDLFEGAPPAAVAAMSRRTTNIDLDGAAAAMSYKTTDFAAAAMSQRTTNFDLKVLIALLVDAVLNPPSSCTPCLNPSGTQIEC